MGELISTGQAARLLGYSRTGVTRLVAAGRLPGCRVGGSWRVNASAVQSLRRQAGLDAEAGSAA